MNPYEFIPLSTLLVKINFVEHRVVVGIQLETEKFHLLLRSGRKSKCRDSKIIKEFASQKLLLLTFMGL